jgi:hypothetical protein
MHALLSTANKKMASKNRMYFSCMVILLVLWAIADEVSNCTSGDGDDYDPEGAMLGSRHSKKAGWWEDSDGEGGSSGGSEGGGPWGSKRLHW